MTTTTRLSIAALLVLLAAPAPARAKGPFEVKSGSYEMTAMQGQKQVVYFDDFGAKKATYTTMAIIPGQETHTLEIELPDGTRYSIDLDQKTGTRMKLPPEMAAMMATTMGPAMLKDAKARDLPPKEFLGRKCEGKEGEAMGMLVRAYSWKGIPVHSEVGARGAKPMVTEVTKLAEGPVPAEKFQVPPGVKITGQ
jgi:hypothetical protein